MTGETTEPELSPEVAVRRRGLRPGWTTGTCASAAAKAAVVALTTGRLPAQVDIGLPGGTRVTFPVLPPPPGPDGPGAPTPPGSAGAVVVKDAGDDPDCTDGAHVTATVCWAPDGSETVIEAGAGVGTVTLPGLGLPVGAPAVNPVPRRMILAAVAEVTDRPVRVVLSVPGGEAMAAKTTNARLGIVGGISILGTTGIVRPFSTAAYRASVVQQVDVAAAQGSTRMILCTGSRSEGAAVRLYPDVPPVCIVEVGDFSGIALRRCATDGMTQVDVVAMVGKIAKLAAGVMMTHFHRSAVDTGFLASVAAATGAPAAVVAGAGETATARHFFELCEAAGVRAPLEKLCALARTNCIAHAGGAIGCSVTMVDFDGTEVVARAA